MQTKDLKPGSYVSSGCPAPTPDKRVKHDWRCVPIEEGTIVHVVEDRGASGLEIWSGKWRHQRVRAISPDAMALVASLTPVYLNRTHGPDSDRRARGPRARAARTACNQVGRVVSERAPLSKAATAKAINEAWWAITRALGGGRASEMFERAHRAAEQGERDHRGFGRRFTHGQARYRLSVDSAARYFACKWFLDRYHEAPSTWADAAEIRDDARYALAARDLFWAGERTTSTKVRGGSEAYEALLKECAPLLAIDYAIDIAER